MQFVLNTPPLLKNLALNQGGGVRTTGSMTVERVAKPLKNSVCTKSRRRLKPKVASILLRTGLNLRFLVESKMRMKLKG